MVEQNGCIIALEGPTDIVSTQLRLLPTSREILVLPDIQHYLQKENKDDEPFSPTQFVHRMHKASEARHAEAQDFLRQSTSEGPRFVFTHGGAIGAQAQCLSAISKHVTDGDWPEADAFFNRLVSYGLDGINSDAQAGTYHKASVVTWEDKVMEQRSTALKPRPSRKGKQVEWSPVPTSTESILSLAEDPIIRAMRAAEALDKETEFLQPANHDVDLTIRLIEIKGCNTRSLSLSAVEYRKDVQSPTMPLTFGGFIGTEAPSSENEPDILLQKDTAEQIPPKIPPRKRPLRIHIPTPSLSWKGKAEVAMDEEVSPTTQSHIQPAPEQVDEKRPWTADNYARSNQEQAGEWAVHPGIQKSTKADWGMFEKWGQQTEAKPVPGSELEPSLVPVLPLHEDFTIYLEAGGRDDILGFVFEGFCDGNYSDRVSTRNPKVSGASRSRPNSCRRAVSSWNSLESSWSDGELIHGLPTPGSSPAPSQVLPFTDPEPNHRLRILKIGGRAPVALQNSVRSLLCSRFPVERGNFKRPPSPRPSVADTTWQPLHCGGAKYASGADEGNRIDMILAIGAEDGVSGKHMSLVTEGIENLGRKRNGISRSARLSLRSLIANAMQTFTAQPLARQCNGNPFSDRSLLAALIIPHLEAYLHAHSGARLLLIEYPAEHLGTVIALQELIGTELFKVVGILNGDGDGSTLIRPLTAPPRPDSHKTGRSGPKFQNEFGDRVRALMGACSFSKANYLLASSASDHERAAFMAAIRESLISVSDFYIPEIPLYKPATAVLAAAQETDLSGNIIKKSNGSRRPTLSLARSASTSHLSSPKPKPSAVISRLDTPPASPAESYLATGVSRSATPFNNNNNHHHRGGRHSPCSSAAIDNKDKIPRSYNTSSTAKMTDRVRWGGVTCYAAAASPLPSSSPSLYSPGFLSKSATTAGGYHRRRFKNEYDDDDDDDDDEDEDEEERRLMPLYLKRQTDKGSTAKAMKLLGLL